MKPIDKEILRLSLPSILANITVPVVGMVDIAVAGHLGESGLIGAAAFIGAVTVGSTLFDLLYWNFGFLRAGTGGLTAQAKGRDDMRGCADIFIRSVGLALALSLLVWAIQLPFFKLSFLFIKASPEVYALAREYFFIRIWAAPATLSLMAFRGWFIGMQDSVRSMMTDLVVNGVNIAASIILALGIGRFGGMGFKGVAYGTLAAQYAGLVYASLALLVRYRVKVFSGIGRDDFAEAFRGSELRRFLSMNGDLFVRSLCMMAVYFGFTAISARFGDLLLACGAIMMKLLMLFSYFTDGFAYAGEALTGRFIGEKSISGTRQAVRHVFLWSLSMVLLFTLAYSFGGVPILRLMTSDETVVNASREFLPWLVLMPVIGCPAFTWDGVYLGATASSSLRDSMIWAAVAFFAVFLGGIVLLRSLFPSVDYYRSAMHLLMAAYFAHLFARTVVLSLNYRRDVLGRWFPGES